MLTFFSEFLQQNVSIVYKKRKQTERRKIWYFIGSNYTYLNIYHMFMISQGSRALLPSNGVGHVVYFQSCAHPQANKAFQIKNLIMHT